MAFYSAKAKPLSMSPPWQTELTVSQSTNCCSLKGVQLPVAMNQAASRETRGRRRHHEAHVPGSSLASLLPSWSSPQKVRRRTHEFPSASGVVGGDEPSIFEPVVEKCQSQATLPLVSHWRRRSHRGPVLSFYKWLADVLVSSQALPATPQIVGLTPNITGHQNPAGCQVNKLIDLRLVREILVKM